MNFEPAKLWCAGRQYTVLEEHVCDRCKSVKTGLAMRQLAIESVRLMMTGELRFADSTTQDETIDLAVRERSRGECQITERFSRAEWDYWSPIDPRYAK